MGNESSIAYRNLANTKAQSAPVIKNYKYFINVRLGGFYFIVVVVFLIFGVYGITLKKYDKSYITKYFQG